MQNVLPSMEAAFVDIGRGRNAVLYAGEVDWDAAGLGGEARRIEQALSSGDSVLVQVTKDPVGHKGARLTTQISLAGRFLVYVPSGGAAGISRKLPDVERKRLKDLLREIVPSEAGVIIRTASEGVTQEALERDVRRLQAQWEVVKEKAEKTGPSKPKAPVLLYEEPDMLIKVVRDQFNEDFSRLVVDGDDAWETVSNYVGHVAPELAARLHRHVGPRDVFEEYRIDEQLLKALERKVLAALGRHAGDRPHRGDDGHRRQHRQVHRLRAATSRRPSPATTSRRPRRSSASCGCATSAASSSSTSSTWCSSPTATWCCGG